MICNELQIVEPPVLSYLHHAYPLTAAQAHKDFFSWFYSNYIQLEFDLNISRLNFFTHVIFGNNIYCPIVDYKVIDLEFLSLSRINIIDFIVDSINMGYYVTTYLDEYYIPERISYYKFHYKHDVMIFGYDLSKSVFKIIGFNDKQQYSASYVSFSEFENSYTNCIDKKNDVILFKAKDELSYEPSFSFDIVNVINLLEDYYFSRDTSERLRIFNNPKKDFIYGMSIYNELIKYFKAIIENDKKDMDIIQLHLLWEHKKCMVSRIKYLISNNFIKKNAILDEYICLENTVLSLRNIFIKFFIVKDKKYIEKIITGLGKLQSTEEQLISSLIENLKLYSY